jgi:hypothetical protein
MADLTEAPNPNFLQFLARFERGALVDRLTEEVKNLVASMEQLDQDYGIQKSKGELKIKIAIKREKGRYEIDVAVDTKTPKPPTASEIMWATPGNALVPENPAQQKFAFTEVVRPRGQQA